MKHIGPILVLCGAAALAVVPQAAGAFEVQDAAVANGASLVAPQQNLFTGDPKAYSLAMPLSGQGDSSSSLQISTYGNSIPIPGPGIDMPAPAWAYSPRGGIGW